MLRKIKSLFTYISKLRGHRKSIIVHGRKQLSSIKEFLTNGIYIYSYKKQIFYRLHNLHKYLVEVKCTYRGVTRYKQTRAIQFLLLSFFERNIIFFIFSTKKSFDGKLVIISSLNNVYKIISYKHKKVLSKYNDRHDFIESLKKREQLKKADFLIPHYFTPSTINDNVIIEDYIIREKYTFFPVSYFINDFLKTQQNDHGKFVKLLSSEEVNAFCYLLCLLGEQEHQRDFERFVSTKSYVCCLQHGDFYRFNYILSKGTFYYIDYERVGYHIFFLDFFKYIFADFHYLYNDIEIKKLFKGNYNVFLKKLFDINNVFFDEKLIKMYFAIMLFENYDYKVPHNITEKIRLFFMSHH